MLINYLPIRLLPIFAKLFKKIIFTSVFECYTENELFTVFQFGCKSYVKYMKYKTHLIKSTYICKGYHFRYILRQLIKFGIKDLSINSNPMEFLVTFLNLLKITQLILRKRKFLTGRPLPGREFFLVFHKDWFSNYFFS